ncbi:MAG: hypothetical protein Q8M57_12910 [Nitrosomonas sp.]|uniref:hypothetical protein n=1 Tax=Nitrosomonas sp. TaxID=42353 RepID=UPI0027311D9A|nr:hypothetical protein [Nitrosomonas sp.]MDP2224501.1 hypothetical protein [Nitrosomonas sp.]MDP3281925.1 hypothetical protein [Nitrosomonas sp.]
MNKKTTIPLFNLKNWHTNCALLLLTLISSTVFCATTPLLRCAVSYADITHQIETRLINDPYRAALHDIGGRFSFKAVMLGTADKIDIIKLYAYLQGREKDFPIHQAIYMPPFSRSSKPIQLTPFNHLYAGKMEREMQYQCTLAWVKA